MLVANEVALHKVAREVIRRILAGESLDARGVAISVLVATGAAPP